MKGSILEQWHPSGIVWVWSFELIVTEARMLFTVACAVTVLDGPEPLTPVDGFVT